MKSPKQITEHDILTFVEETYPIICRGADIHRDFAQITGQHGMMLAMLFYLLNDENCSWREHYQKSIQKVLAAKRKKVTR